MRVKLNHVFTEASGKLCKKESTYVSYNKKTGKMYTAEYHDREDNLNEKELAVREKFNSRQAFAANWWKTNKAQQSDDYKTVMEMYDAQSRIGNPYSFFLSLIQKDMTIKLKDKTVSSGGSSGGNTSPSGGGGDTF